MKENVELSLPELIEQAMKIDKARIEVMPFSYLEKQGRYVVAEEGVPQFAGLPPELPGIVFRSQPQTVNCKTFYCSYDMTDSVKNGFGQIIGRRVRTCEETNIQRAYSETDSKDYLDDIDGVAGIDATAYEIQNILTANQRVRELREIFPEAEISLVIPAGNARLCEESRDRVLARALSSGLEPFPAPALESAT